jgi:hypothetical protein
MTTSSAAVGVRRRAGDVDGKAAFAEFRLQDAGQTIFIFDDQ